MKKIFGLLIYLFIGISLTIPTSGLCQNPLVEILATVNRLKFVGEQNIVLKAEIVFYQQINPFWEELVKINFSPFKLEKMILGERKIFDREKELTRDCREVTFLLSLPASSNCGSYAIPAFSLNYSYFQGKSEIKGAVKSKAIKVEKVPILVTISMAKDAITIGENNTIRLTIWREKFIHLLNQELKSQNGESQVPEDEGFRRWLKSLEVRGQKITDLNKPDFAPFKLLAKSVRTEIQGSIVMEVFEYRFAFYELGGKEFPLPKFYIWYLNKSQEDKTQKPKEIVTPPLVIQINSVVRPGRKTLEWLKLPEANRKNNIYYFGYGPMALGGLLLMIFGTSILLGIIRGRRKCDISAEICESPSEIYSNILSLKDNQSPERASVIKIRNEIFKMLGSILKISATQSIAKTTNQMISLLTQSGFSENSIKELKSCFSELDILIQKHQAGQDISEIKRIINHVLAVSEISRACKKRKKYLIF